MFKKCLSQNSFRFVTDAPLKNGREQRGGRRSTEKGTFGGVQAGLPGNPSSEDTPDSFGAATRTHTQPTSWYALYTGTDSEY